MLWHAELGEAPRCGTARCAVYLRELRSHADWKTRVTEGLPPEIAEETPQGHAALLIEERGVLVAGDMLSDLFIPMPDFEEAADPIEDYLAGLLLLEGVADDVDVVIPVHGSVGADQVRPRIVSTKPGWEWVSDMHAGHVQQLANRRERDGTPD